jgi:iron(III) transport system permease protein
VIPAAGASAWWARRNGRPVVLMLLATLIALLLLAPLVFLLLEAHQYGWSSLRPLLFRQLTWELLWNSVRLTVVVTATCAVLGTLAAWCVERTDLPGRRVWAVLLVLPVAIPDFVVAFGWVSLAPGLRGFFGAWLVMTLAVYPLVYLPVASSFRRADPGQEEVARSLGAGRFRTFWSVSLGQARLAILGGCLLVSLILLAEYGAFEILGYRTFTTTIFAEFQVGFNTPAACALSLVLVVVSIVVLTAEVAARGRGRVSRVGAFAQRRATRRRLGRATMPVLAGFAGVIGLALGVPLGAIAYWIVAQVPTTLPTASVTSAVVHTAAYSAGAGLLATAMALPVGLLTVRYPSRFTLLLERSTNLVLALPGLVIALALTYFSERYADGLWYQTSVLLIVAYAVMFFPLALVAVRTSVAQAPNSLEEVGYSLGRSRLAVLWRVTLPLVAPGLAAAFCLVFLEAVIELTATLVLIPTGAQTLATQFWLYQTNAAYSQAAPYAALMVGIAAIPTYVLGRWFDRLPLQDVAAGTVVA